MSERARQTGEALADILARALKEYRRQSFLRGLAEDFAALRSDPDAWDEEMRERQAWEATLGDDLMSRSRPVRLASGDSPGG